MRKENGETGSYLDIAQRVLAPVGSFNEMAARSVERAVRLQYDLAGDWMQFAFAQLHAAAASRDPGTLLASQAEVSSQFAEKIGRRQQDLARISAETQADFARWFDESSAG
jgi:phasin family protein